jgi:hypothetical protein
MFDAFTIYNIPRTYHNNLIYRHFQARQRRCSGAHAHILLRIRTLRIPRRPDLTMETIEAYLHNLFRVQPDFVYSVSRDFARSCQTPILVMPDDTAGHPYQVAMDIAALAPKAEVTVYPWKEPKDLWVKTVQQVRDFLKAHQPATAAR